MSSITKSFGIDNEVNTNALTIEADNYLEYFEKQNYYLASGNVVAKKKKLTLRSNKLKIFFNKQKKDNPTFISAVGNIIISNDKIYAQGENVNYNIEKNKIILFDGNQMIKTPNSKIQSSGKIIYNVLTGNAYANKKVKVTTNKNVKIFADEVFAYFKTKNKILSNARALGNVLIITNKNKVETDRAEFNQKDNLIKLTGNVVISSKNAKIQGSTGTTNLNTGVSKITSNNKKNKRVKGIFLPNSN